MASGFGRARRTAKPFVAAAAGIAIVVVAIRATVDTGESPAVVPVAPSAAALSVPASVLPAPAKSAAVGPAAAASLPPPAEAPPGVDPRRVLFASSVCAAATMTLPDGSLDVGCPSHPPFDRPEQKPDGKLTRFTGDPLRFCGIDAIHEGSFTRPGARQAFIAFAQCKENPPHDDDWDTGNPGSGVLVEEIAGRWAAIGYEPAVNARSCVVRRRPDARDVLLCRAGFEAGLAGGVTYLFLLDVAREGKHAVTFATIFDDMLLCAGLSPPAPGELRLPNGLTTVSIEGFAAASAGSAVDLVVDVDRAHAAASPALDARAARACARGPSASAKSVLPPPTRSRLEFALRGDDVVPTEPTRRALAAWKGEVDDHGGVAAAAPPVAE